MNDLVRIDSKPATARLVLFAGIVVAILFSWIGASRQVGNLLNEITGLADPDAAEIAEVAKSMAPGDPLGMWLRASLSRSVASPDKTEASMRLFEETVRLAPRDYRWWIELGRAYEQADELEKAEAALRKAVGMAPTFNYPHWQLGNFLLRRNRSDEAFAELKLATINNHAYRNQVFSLAWDYFDKDPAKVESLAFESGEAYSSLALFYAVRGRAADSLRVWNKLTDEEKAASLSIAKTITQGLYDKRFFNEALSFARDTGVDTTATHETITNGGFETVVGQTSDTYFNWRIARGDAKVEIASDSAVKHSGGRSLRINFRGFARPEFHNTFQTVATKPSKAYRLKFWIRTENLKSGGPPVVQVVNAVDDRIIVASKPFSQGTNDWTEIEVGFTTPENCEGIVIRTGRTYCGENCPIIGTLWYDDFLLESAG
jgi:tetratricopeptide (TPR) repeat protein